MNKKSKFKLIFLILYSIAFLAVFICAMNIKNSTLRFWNAVLIITWFPIIIVLISTNLLQAKAGNFYKYLTIADKEKAKEMLLPRTSAKLFQSEEFNAIINKEYLPKIRSVSHIKKEDEVRRFKIKTTDGGAYILHYILRNDEILKDSNEKWVVDKIEYIPYKPA